MCRLLPILGRGLRHALRRAPWCAGVLLLLIGGCTTPALRRGGAPPGARRSAATIGLPSPLTAPGTLAGSWIRPGCEATLVVEPVEGTSCAPDELAEFGGRATDVFRVSVRDSRGAVPDRSFLFRSSHGKFALRGVDVDGDGVDEIVMEQRQGRGTFAVTTDLVVRKCFEERYVEVLRPPLEDYLWPTPEAHRAARRDPLPWRRDYTLLAVPGTPGAVLRLELVPVDTTGRCLHSDVVPIFHLPRVDLRYNARHEAFEIVDCDFRRLDQADGPTSSDIPR